MSKEITLLSLVKEELRDSVVLSTFGRESVAKKKELINKLVRSVLYDDEIK